MQDFGTEYRSARKAAGLSQETIAEILKIPTRTQQHWESGERFPPEYTQILLLDKLQQLTPEKITVPESK
jgi:DNA-binding transcriptional regulator YiaG